MYNVLLVDDKEAYRRGIQRMSFFRKPDRDFQIAYTAQNGAEALDYLHTQNIDVVLTDIRMPIMDGMVLLKEIHKNDLCKCTILISEYSDFTYAREGIVYGAFDYIVKPAKEDQLREIFARASQFLQKQADQVNLDDIFIKKLAACLLETESENDVDTLLDVIENKIREQGEISRMSLYAGHILSGLPDALSSSCSWLTQYIPLEMVCSEPLRENSSEELLASFSKRIRFLDDILKPYRFSHPNDQVGEICRYIVENIESIKGVQQLAEEFCLNKNYLSTLFNRETGSRCVDFINYYKVEHAKLLVSCTDFKMQAIAETVGFNDVEYFTRVFKRYTGKPPREFHWKKIISAAGIDNH